MPSLAELLATASGRPLPQAPETPERSGVLGSLLSPFSGTDQSDPLMQLVESVLASRGDQGGAAGPALSPSGAVDVTGLASRRGVTLQEEALGSLIQALRAYDLRPGARELGLFGPGSTYRTHQQQVDLYRRKPGVAAPPGQSLHEEGLAIDLPRQLQNQAFFNLLRQLGWWQLPSEPWHWSAPGHQG